MFRAITRFTVGLLSLVSVARAAPPCLGPEGMFERVESPSALVDMNSLVDHFRSAATRHTDPDNSGAWVVSLKRNPSAQDQNIRRTVRAALRCSGAGRGAIEHLSFSTRTPERPRDSTLAEGLENAIAGFQFTGESGPTLLLSDLLETARTSGVYDLPHTTRLISGRMSGTGWTGGFMAVASDRAAHEIVLFVSERFSPRLD